jgi:tellurite resistance protein TerC
VAGLLDRLVYLSTGLSLVLLFIGLKLLLHYLHLQGVAVPEISPQLSLAVVVTVIAITAAASVGRLRREPGARAHAGALRAEKRPRREPPSDEGGG